MAQRITCPDCKSVLRPAKPLPDGKKIKCPKCGTPFTTPGLVEDGEPPRPKTPAKKKNQAAIKKAAAPAPAPKKPADDEDEGGGIYGYVPDEVKADEDKPQIDYAPDMSIKDLRGPAQAAVVRPTNYLLLVGGLCCLSNIFLICVSFWPMVFSDSVLSETEWKKVLINHHPDDKSAKQKIEGIKERKDLKADDEEVVSKEERSVTLVRLLIMSGLILLLAYNVFAIIGAVKAQNLESRGWGIASSIMTILPMGSGGLSLLIGYVFYKTLGSWILDEMALPYSIGLGVLPYILALVVGVWSLRTLMSEEVIEGYEYVAE